MTINEFAKLCKCNTQTLRYYDKINLLKPLNVNAETGYRYYAKEQALDFVKIKNLQLASFSLEEISNFLTAEPTEVYQAFSAKINKQKAILQKLEKIQESYRTEYMQAQKLLDELKAKIENSMAKFNHKEEFGLSDDEFAAIKAKSFECFDNVCLDKGIFSKITPKTKNAKPWTKVRNANLKATRTNANTFRRRTTPNTSAFAKNTVGSTPKNLSETLPHWIKANTCFTLKCPKKSTPILHFATPCWALFLTPTKARNYLWGANDTHLKTVQITSCCLS